MQPPQIDRLIKHPRVTEVGQLVTRYHVVIDGNAVHVDVYRYLTSVNPQWFKAYSDHGLLKGGAATGVPYTSTHPKETAEEALADSILGLLDGYDPENGDRLVPVDS